MASFIPQFSSLSEIVKATGKAAGTYNKLTNPSLTAFTKQANIMSRLYIEDSILRDDICVPLVGTLNQLYVSYILAALNLDTMCANGRTVREQFELVATESYDVIDEIMNNFGKSGCTYSNEETIVKLEPDTQRLPVGRVIELSMTGIQVLQQSTDISRHTDEGSNSAELGGIPASLNKNGDVEVVSSKAKTDDKGKITNSKRATDQSGSDKTQNQSMYQFKAYLYVQLVPYVLTPTVVEGYIGANFDPPVSKRWTKYKAGEISFWKDFIFARDLIKKQAKVLKQDKHGVVLDMMNRQRSALFRWWEGVMNHFTGVGRSVSHNLANTILITSKATFDKACKENGINFSNGTQRQKFFNKTWSMIICVVDPLYNTVEMYFNGVDMKGTYNFAMINKVGAKGQDNFDLKEVMSAFSQGLTPKF